MRKPTSVKKEFVDSEILVVLLGPAGSMSAKKNQLKLLSSWGEIMKYGPLGGRGVTDLVVEHGLLEGGGTVNTVG